MATPQHTVGVGWEVRSATVRAADDSAAGGIVADLYDRPDPDTGELVTVYVTYDPARRPGQIGWEHHLPAGDLDPAFTAAPYTYTIKRVVAILAAHVADEARKRRVPPPEAILDPLAAMTRLWRAATGR